MSAVLALRCLRRPFSLPASNIPAVLWPVTQRSARPGAAVRPVFLLCCFQRSASVLRGALHEEVLAVFRIELTP